MTQQAGTRARARDEFARLLTERGHPRDGVPWRAALDSGGTLRDRLLAQACTYARGTDNSPLGDGEPGFRALYGAASDRPAA
ncbi:hypothetical protein [Nonomuraea sp. NPDC049709]|uniref:hypothetical protein n=1 Tax=Nonomuraea sp. NPDC049709 TaxID=3154736 RepID=UPI00342A9836